MVDTLRHELKHRWFGAYIYGVWRIAPVNFYSEDPPDHWNWWHRHGEYRGGSATTLSDCIAEIHEWEDEHDQG